MEVVETRWTMPNVNCGRMEERIRCQRRNELRDATEDHEDAHGEVDNATTR